MSAFTVGNQLVYSYSGGNGSTYAYYNGTAHEGSVIIRLNGYPAILIPLGDNNDYWSICDNNFNEITRIPFDYLGNYFLNIPNNNSVVTNSENYGILTDAWQFIKLPSSAGNTVCLFNFNGNIYIADDHSIYTENYEVVNTDEYSTIADCKVLENTLYVGYTSGSIRTFNTSFSQLWSHYVWGVQKLYPLKNGDIITTYVSGDLKRIYKYDHVTENTKQLYELNDASTTFYDLGYFDKLNEVLVITNRGFIGVIDDYVTEMLNSAYTTYAFVKNQQPRFVGVWGMKGTIDIMKGSSIIRQITDMTLKLNVGENNLVFTYESDESMMMNLFYCPKYIGV